MITKLPKLPKLPKIKLSPEELSHILHIREMVKAQFEKKAVGPVQILGDFANSAAHLVGQFIGDKEQIANTVQALRIPTTTVQMQEMLDHGIILLDSNATKVELAHELVHSLRHKANTWSSRQYGWNPVARLVEETAANRRALQDAVSMGGAKRHPMQYMFQKNIPAVLQAARQEIQMHPKTTAGIALGIAGLIGGGLMFKNHMDKKASVVERTVQEQVDNNEGWRKWFFSNNRQDDSGAMKHPLSSDSLWLKKADLAEDNKKKLRRLDLVIPVLSGAAMAMIGNRFVATTKADKILNMAEKTIGGISAVGLPAYYYGYARPKLKRTISDLEKQSAKQVLKGGLADKKSDSEFNQNSLRKGMKAESEHTSNPKVQKEIAEDHLTEDKRYYQKLQKMEKDASVRSTLAKAKELLSEVPGQAKKVKNALATIPLAIDDATAAVYRTTVTTAVNATKNYPKIQKAIVDHAHDPSLLGNMTNPLPGSTEAHMLAKNIVDGVKKVTKSKPVKKALTWIANNGKLMN